MDERSANIDLVFRNGLKDYEVLPPPEVWHDILPAIKVKRNYHFVLKTAAVLVVLTALSFFAYEWSREINSGSEGFSVALNMEAASPIYAIVTEPAISFENMKSQTSDTYQKDLNIVLPQKNYFPDVAAESLMGMTADPEVNTLASMPVYTDKGPLPATLSSLPRRSFGFAEIESQVIQDNSQIESPERWSIAALASPTYYSSLGSNSNDLSKQITQSEESMISYSGGVAVSYKINKRFTIQTGLYYASIGQQLQGINSFSGFEKYDNTKGAANFEVLTSAGRVVTSNADVFLAAPGSSDRIRTVFTNDVFDPAKASLQQVDDKLLQKFSYLELPIFLRYKLIDKALDFNLIGGISYNMLVNNDVYTYQDGAKYPIGDTRGLNPLTLSSSLGMGMEYSFSDKLSFNLEPTVRYYINPFTQATATSGHPYSFGIFSGLSYRF